MNSTRNPLENEVFGGRLTLEKFVGRLGDLLRNCVLIHKID